MKRPDEVKREFVRQWMLKADADLATARHLVATRIDLGFAIGFHAQQAVEKIAKKPRWSGIRSSSPSRTI